MRILYVLSLFFQLALQTRGEACQEEILQSLLKSECKFDLLQDHFNIEEACKKGKSCEISLRALQERCPSEFKDVQAPTKALKFICDNEELFKASHECHDHLLSCLDTSNRTMSCKEMESCVMENLDEKCPKLLNEITTALSKCSDTNQRKKRGTGQTEKTTTKRDKRDMKKVGAKPKTAAEVAPAPIKRELTAPDGTVLALKSVKIDKDMTRTKRRIRKRKGKGRKKGKKAFKKRGRKGKGRKSAKKNRKW